MAWYRKHVSVVTCLCILVILLKSGSCAADTHSSKESKENSKESKPDISGHIHGEERKSKHDDLGDGGTVDRFKKQAKKWGIDLDVGFMHAFIASLAVIIVSELGDKTFFIAAIMAMRHSRVTVFTGALGALAFMTVLSALMGYATSIIPRKLTFYISSLLFAVFGIKMLREGYNMSPDEGQEEYEEVQADLKKREDEIVKANMGTQDVETGIIRTPSRRWFRGFLSTIFLQAFTLTFLAEWGDRSQIATIILAARAETEDIIGVIIGGTLGHALCTGLAVLGGRFIAQRISVKTVTLIGGSVFILFALSAFVIGP